MSSKTIQAFLPRVAGWPRRPRVLNHVFARFCVVGGVGFAVNYSALLLIHGSMGASIAVAQLVGAELAIISNFILHASWTYRNDYRHTSLTTRLLRFHTTAVAGGLINSAIVVASVNYLHLSPLAGLVAGSGIALIWNFLWTRHYVWSKGTAAQAVPPAE